MLEVCELGHHVLVVSAQAEPEVVLGAIAAGARGFLSKDVDAEELLIAIKTVADGGAYVSAVVAGMIMKDNADRPAVRRTSSCRRARNRCCGWWRRGSVTSTSR